MRRDLFQKIIFLAVFVALAAIQCGVAAAQGHTCPGMDAGSFRLRADWKLPLLKSQTGMKAILISVEKDGNDDELNVNSDGSPRAYHPLDPQGRKYALNDMPSGAVDVYVPPENDQRILRGSAQYYEVLERFFSGHNNFGASESKYRADKEPIAQDDPKYRVGDDFNLGLDAPPTPPNVRSITPSTAPDPDFVPVPLPVPGTACKNCADNSCRVCFRTSIFKVNASNEPCVRQTGRYKGFLVNKTSLDNQAGNPPDAENAEDQTCESKINLDPEKLPGVVLPLGGLSPDGTTGMKATIGDIVVGYSPRTGNWAFGIVSDEGPRGKLGEASIAFNRILQVGYRAGTRIFRPERYQGDAPNLVSSRGPNMPLRPIVMLLLPNTAQRFHTWNLPQNDKDFSPKTVATKAKAAFLEWAGTSDLSQARAKFLGCYEAIPASPP